MFSIKRVTELDVFRVVTESGSNPDYIIQDALTAPSAPPSASLFVSSGWEVLALIAKSHLVRAVVLFLPCVTHVDRCLAAQAQTGVDPGRLEWQGEAGWGGGRGSQMSRAVTNCFGAAYGLRLRCVLVPVCLVSAGEHGPVCKASVSSAHAGNPNAPVASADIHELNYSWRDSKEHSRAPERRVGCIKQNEPHDSICFHEDCLWALMKPRAWPSYKEHWQGKTPSMEKAWAGPGSYWSGGSWVTICLVWSWQV